MHCFAFSKPSLYKREISIYCFAFSKPYLSFNQQLGSQINLNQIAGVFFFWTEIEGVEKHVLQHFPSIIVEMIDMFLPKTYPQ